MFFILSSHGINGVTEMELECVWFFVLDFPPAAGGLAKFKVVTALEPAILSVAVETPKESVLSSLVVECLCARVCGELIQCSGYAVYCCSIRPERH